MKNCVILRWYDFIRFTMMIIIFKRSHRINWNKWICWSNEKKHTHICRRQSGAVHIKSRSLQRTKSGFPISFHYIFSPWIVSLYVFLFVFYCSITVTVCFTDFQRKKDQKKLNIKKIRTTIFAHNRLGVYKLIGSCCFVVHLFLATHGKKGDRKNCTKTNCNVNPL